ncbi:MAG TPA: dihydrodipicolinate synthase family protein [Terracidiphilus sp.]|nr:dihydrodipicolinate synthase family protein [Terracidiphilus sp.]
MPAMTTAFDEQLHVDHDFIDRHARWLKDNGCTGIVCLGSLGEAATLAFDEKIAIIKTVAGAVSPAIPTVAAISSLSTWEAVDLAKAAAKAGAQGLMILPPYVYQGDWRETKAHIAAILTATPLEAMLYNNPVAYGTDFLPEQIAELAADFPNLVAVKESSTDVRRVTAIRAICGDRLAVLVGVDDAIVEGIEAGACGWIAGLVNALPRESVDLFNRATDGHMEAALELYRWFLPLLRMDTVPKFVQLIKQVQEEAGIGSSRVRPPRLQLVGDELTAARSALAHAQKHRPGSAPTSSAFKNWGVTA